MEPATIATQLRELAMYYELDGDRNRAFAYERAARSVEAANGLHRLIDEGRLEELPGIGPSIALAVAELARRGTVAVLERLRGKWPPVVIELAQLPKVGVGKARAIYLAFTPTDLDSVAELCRAGAIRELKGFGKVSEQKILEAIEDRRLRGLRVILFDAEPQAISLANHLRADPAALRVEVAGPVRRWCEVVDHLAYAIATHAPEAVVERLASHGLVAKVEPHVLAIETPMITAQLAGGLRADVHLATPARFGWAHVVATGSPDHVELLLRRAADRGLDLATLDAPDEHAVYAALGLPWLPPEVRDGTDELSGEDFTDLVTLADITTACHCHTTYSDGKASVVEMMTAAAELGLQAITITDHSAAATYASGLDLERLRQQADEIAGLAGSQVRVLRGTEADILVDGAIDVPREIVGELDLVIASVHQRFSLDEDAMTNRLVTAMRQPFFKIWGHALGRLVLRREPIKVRLDDILDAITESRAAIEINGDPYRLDLDPVSARRAVARGIKFVLSSDAHSVKGLAATRFAVGMARRARIRKRDVLNALPPDELAAAIRP